MLTATLNASVSDSVTLVQNETPVSDIEVSRRVLAIRSKWSVGERIRRRREAERRFTDLIEALACSEAA
ncbi:hypothetical protein [Novipirellula artificiosorum]|uniref:Uncharacterized protein n=1 Tax=Novipirellula artificiosorum TaxID=2528016 RepID=A0A5C6DUB1_9BACT|nr:hypothetical protein [Novipirellula artificiosorum]TWU40963.1 hypothetical protein Poly41_17980 [Novipirellula artificiosorum]